MAITSGQDGLARRAGLAALATVPVAGAVAAKRYLDKSGGTRAMPLQDERSRIAHLFRRAGFGASPAELDMAMANGYDATLEHLLNPADDHDIADDTLA